MLPYAAMAAVWALTVAVLVTGGLDGRSWVVAGGALVTTVLVIGRQLSAFRHIIELLRERDELTAQLTRLAYHDALTGLANRGMFMRPLHDGLAAGPVTVFLVDLDDFKPVNDRFGHATGDQSLIEVTAELDRALCGTVRIGAAEVPLRASVGMASGRHGEHDPDSLPHAADMAMYAVREARADLVGSDLQ